MTIEEKNLQKKIIIRSIVYIPLFLLIYAVGFCLFRAMLGTAISSRVRGANATAMSYVRYYNTISGDDEEFEKAHSIAENCIMYGEWVSKNEMLIYKNENFPEDTVVNTSDYFDWDGDYRYFAIYTENGIAKESWCSKHQLTAEELTAYEQYDQKCQANPINPPLHPIKLLRNGFVDYGGLVGWSGGV